MFNLNPTYFIYASFGAALLVCAYASYCVIRAVVLCYAEHKAEAARRRFYSAKEQIERIKAFQPVVWDTHQDHKGSR